MNEGAHACGKDGHAGPALLRYRACKVHSVPAVLFAPPGIGGAFAILPAECTTSLPTRSAITIFVFGMISFIMLTSRGAETKTDVEAVRSKTGRLIYAHQGPMT